MFRVSLGKIVYILAQGPIAHRLSHAVLYVIKTYLHDNKSSCGWRRVIVDNLLLNAFTHPSPSIKESKVMKICCK